MVGVLCFAAYAAMVAPGPYWLDSSEFAAAAFGLGVAHPPGHPLASLVGKAASLVPLGAIALRVGMAQALCGAIAAALVTLIGAELARRTAEAMRAAGHDGSSSTNGDGDGDGDRDAWVAAGCGAAAGLGFGLSHAATLQSVRPEVYSLHALLALAAVLALVRFDRDGDPRRLLAAALALGLALANHHFLALLIGLAATLYVATQHGRLRRVGAGRLLGWLLLAGALGLACYAYLPLRALHHPEVDWGSPSTLARFLWTVSARAFQRSLQHAALGGGTEVALALARELGWLLPLALAGLAVMLRQRALRSLALLCAGGALLDAAAPALVGFDPANPDAYGYLELAVALPAALAAVAPAALVAWLAGRLRRVSPSRSPSRSIGPLIALGGAALALVQGAPRLPSMSLLHFGDTERVAGAILDEAPPRALLISSYYQTVFPLWYLRAVEGRRPDVDHVHRHFLAWPGYAGDVTWRRPELGPLLGSRDLEPGPLVALAARRPVRLEYDLDLDDQLALRLAPGVLVEALLPAGAAASRGAMMAAGQRAALLEARLDLGEPETWRFVFWRAFLDAHRDCRQGRTRDAQAAIARARALLGGNPDPDLEELSRRCGG